MSNLKSTAEQLTEDEGPLQGAVWLTQDLGIAMPPVPGEWAGDIEEFGLSRLFATNVAMLDLDSPGSIATAITSGSMKTGLAFGYVPRGQGGRWFYTLAGARLVLHVSLRSQFDPTSDDDSIMPEASFAHGMIERYLRNPSNYAAAISTAPQTMDAICRIISYSDEVDGTAAERQATWSLDTGLSAFKSQREVFVLEQDEPFVPERVIWI